VGDVPPAQRELLEVVKRNADREVALVNDLLDLSLLEAGRLDLRFSHIHLGAAIAAVCDALQPQLDARRLTLTRAVEPNLPPVWADSNRIVQVLTALLSNAGKYTPPGGRVEVRAAAAPAGVRVDVQDTGIGLTPDELDQLFTRFFRGRNPEAAAAGGSGLGLAISRQLIELHGGELTVASTPGEGATFSVLLPLAPSLPAPPGAGSEPPETPAPPAPPAPPAAAPDAPLAPLAPPGAAGG
jgi:signal transduction histidine kinase